MVKILFLAANPLSTTRLRLDQESRAIYYALQNSNLHDKFQLEKHYAIRVGDLQNLILRHSPDIIHFSGHGNDASEIIVEDSNGCCHAITSVALSNLFSHFSKDVSCILLNACYSESQAQAISQHISYVIGVSSQISDEASISFSAAFYQALGYGQDIQKAFDLACNQLELENLLIDGIPKLLINPTPPKSKRFFELVSPFDSPVESEEVGLKQEFLTDIYEQRKGCYVDLKRGIIAIILSATILFLALSGIVQWTVQKLNSIMDNVPQPTPTIRPTLMPTFTSTPVDVPVSSSTPEVSLLLTQVSTPILIPTDTPIKSNDISLSTSTPQTSANLGGISSFSDSDGVETRTVTPTPIVTQVSVEIPTNLEVVLEEPLGEYIFGKARFRWSSNFSISDLGSDYVYELVFWEENQDPMIDGFSPLEASTASDVYVEMHKVDPPHPSYFTLKVDTLYRWGIILGRKSADGTYERIQFLKSSHPFLWTAYDPDAPNFPTWYDRVFP